MYGVVKQTGVFLILMNSLQVNVWQETLIVLLASSVHTGKQTQKSVLHFCVLQSADEY